MITETESISFDESTYTNYRMELKADSTFTLNETPFIGGCESGRYELVVDNQLSMSCTTMDFLETNLSIESGKIQIQFVRGDPDSYEKVTFEKMGK